MLGRLLGEFQKFGLLQGQPEVTAKYLIAGEFSLGVLDMFLSRLFGEGGREEEVSRVNGLLDDAGVGCGKDEDGDLSCHAAKHDCAIEELKRQVSALQRQIQMQGEVSSISGSLERRFDEISRELRDRASRVSASVERIEGDVLRLKADIVEMARSSEVKELSDAVSDLKESEARLAADVKKDPLVGILARLRSDVADECKTEELGNLVSEAASVMAKNGSLQKVKSNLRRITGVFAYEGDPLDGIIAFLTSECGGNVHVKGLVEVTASSVYESDCGPGNAVDLATDSNFISKNESESWICYDFKERRVTPSSYAIKSYPYRQGGDHPRSWVFEASKDGSTWKVMDSREDNNDLNDRSVVMNFHITKNQSGGFRFVRLRQTATTHRGNDYLRISALEVFGTLSPK